MTLVLATLAILLGGACLVLLAGKHSPAASLLGCLSCLAGGGAALVAAVQTLVNHADLAWSVSWAVPAGDFALHLDALAACFILPISLLGICSAVYGAGYLQLAGKHRPLAPHWFFYNLLFAAMLLVVTAANTLLFLAAWELMTVASFFLVAWDHRQEQVRKAAWLYLLAAHCGFMLLLAFFVQAGVLCNSFNFADFGRLAQLPAGTAAIFFLLGLFGFGVKAGLLPLHIWLPDAHPAAPSHVSALMSGVLVKTGIYGILRILSLLPPAPAWWGWLIVLLGMSGALYGITLAALQTDIKRCLAYSTIENVGIILLGLGFGLVAQAQGRPDIALLAYAGGLLHIWNHALFKGVLFLGAGALLHATGTTQMNRMGGLLRRMPMIGLLWIGGSLAAGALPPLNGLVSEWLIYLGLLQAGTAPDGFSALPALLLFGLLGLVGALALLTFTRLIGICLLGEPRSDGARHAHEASLLMLVPMGLLLLGCLLNGLFPQAALRLLRDPLAQLLRQAAVLDLPLPLARFSQGGILLLLVVGLVALLLLTLRRLRPATGGPTWGCGFRFPNPRMSYTGEAYSELAFRHALPKPLCPEIEGGRVTDLFPKPARVRQLSFDPILTRQWLPLFVRIADTCQRLRWLQQGRLAIYLLYMFVLSTLLLSWSIWTGRGG
jgi:formate hydrogenlyase subunit 3/multisubunit Na+/H+ antiporter MnhD subunit